MRNVFFSFHYEADIFRANVVRNAWVRKGGVQSARYRDKSMWEAAKTQDPRALKRLIRDALHGTSVTVVLIGEHTADRKWIVHEIKESWKLGKGILGVNIHGIRDFRTGQTSWPGPNPFEGIQVPDEYGQDLDLGDIVDVYDWWEDEGEANFASWVEVAAQAVGR